MADERVVIHLQVDAETGELKGVVDGLEKVQGSAKKAKSAVDPLDASFTKAGAAARAMGGQVGASVERLGNLAKAMGPLAAAGGPVLAVAANVAVAGAAFAKFATTMVEITRHAGEVADRLHGLGLITGDMRDTVLSANDALDSTQVAADLLSTTLAAEFAPTLTDIATLLTAATLAANDLTVAVAKSTDFVEMGAQMIGDVFGDRLKLTTLALRLLRAQTDETAEGFGVLTDSAEMAARGEFVLAESTRSYMEQARDLIGALGEEREAHDEAAAAVTKHDDATKGLIDTNKRLSATLEEQQAAVARGMAQQGKNAAVVEAAAQEQIRSVGAVNEARNTAAEEERGRQQALHDATVGLAFDTATAVAGLVAAQLEDSKAKALIQVAIDTAQAIVRAIAMFGPPPSPLGIAGIAAAVGIGGVQAAIIAGQGRGSGTINTKPRGEKRHSGGEITSGSGAPVAGGAPDERWIRALVGETVGRGGGGGSAPVVVVQLDQQLFEAQTGRALRRADSRLARAVRQSTFQRRYRTGT